MPGHTYKSYSFIDKDPIIDEVYTIIEDAGVTYSFIEHASGVTANTLKNWFLGTTKRPQAATINAVLRTINHQLTITPRNFILVPNPIPKLTISSHKVRILKHRARRG